MYKWVILFQITTIWTGLYGDSQKYVYISLFTMNVCLCEVHVFMCCVVLLYFL